MPDLPPEGGAIVVEDEGPPEVRVGLSGFQPLVADVLALALARQGLHAAPLRQQPDRRPAPDVVVAALDHNTLGRLDELRAAMPKVPIVVVVPSVSGPVRQVARRAEVAAVIMRSSGVGRLTEVLEVVLAGGAVAPVEEVATSPLAVLTERELVVLRMVAVGSTNAEIGAALGISPHTARTHVQNMMAKLGVRTRLGAGAVARKAGLTSGGAG